MCNLRRIAACLVVVVCCACTSLFSAVGITPGLTVGAGAFTTTTNYSGKTQVSGPLLIISPGYYILTKDITVAGTAFGIMANNVTLDLNGHTITYGTGAIQNSNVITYNSLQSGNVGHHAIVCPVDPREGPDYSFGWNAAYTGVVIKNGTITQGTGAGLAYSDALDLTGLSGASITDLVVNVSAADSGDLCLGPNSQAYGNTFNNTVTTVSNRHQQMYSVWGGVNDTIYNNILDGSPQEGVKCGSGDVIHDNLIKPRVTVTNGYAVMGSNNIVAFNNTINTYNGRGIHVNANNITAYNNYVEVRETGNSEYDTMQTHGIKLEGATNSTVIGNVVVDYSSTTSGGTKHGQPTPLNFTVVAGSNNKVSNNSFTAKNLASEYAASLYLIGTDGTGTQISDNSFYSNNYSVGVAWDGASNNTVRRCNFRKTTPTDSVVFFNGGPGDGAVDTSLNNRFIDCAFYAINPKTNAWWNGGVTCEYSVGYSLGITARDGANVLGGASVSITCANNTTITGTTDADGNFSADLMQFKFSHTNNTATETDYKPYTLTISEAGHPTRSLTFNSIATMQGTVDVSASNLVILAPSQLRKADTNLSYSFTLSAATTASTTWSLASGNTLPAGLSLGSGVISGTPTQSGDYSFIVQAVSGGLTSQKLLQLEVAPELHYLGDANCDGKVDGQDLAIIGLNWSPAGANATWEQGDFNGDGCVDGKDLAILGLNWSPGGVLPSSDAVASGTTVSVPEPASLCLLLIGLTGLAARRKQPVHSLP